MNHFINCLFNDGIRSKIRGISLTVYLTLVCIVKYKVPIISLTVYLTLVCVVKYEAFH